MENRKLRFLGTIAQIGCIYSYYKKVRCMNIVKLKIKTIKSVSRLIILPKINETKLRTHSYLILPFSFNLKIIIFKNKLSDILHLIK